MPVPKAATRTLARVRSEAGLQRIGPARDLRPVIALTTILGPCRALGSRDALPAVNAAARQVVFARRRVCLA